MGSLDDWLISAVRRGPDRLALVGEGRSLTYLELEAEVTRAAESGPAAGAVAAVPARSDVAFVVQVHALARAGAAIAPHDPSTAPPPLPRRSDAQSVVFTSGTTAQPRPVELTRANHEASALALGERLGLGPDDRWLSCMPLFGVGGLAIVHRAAIFASALVVHERFDAERVRAELEDGSVTHISLVPTMLERLRRAGMQEAPGLRALLLGGGPIPQGLLDWASERALPVVPTYGMTETASAVATGRPARPLSGVAVRIAAGGEILVRGPMVATQGWLRTGDLGRLDTEGRLTIQGRLKDTIITGGQNVAPLRVEAALETHPAVAEAGVGGLPDPHWGEAVTAFVVVRGKPSVHELLAHARERLQPHEVPKGVKFVDALPRNPAGNLLRSELRRIESPPR
ncbi:MAG: AMP-binding protein [Actinomycetota bacterium]|nr:AMP-binding protein [Actinomycetota bacterium]